MWDIVLYGYSLRKPFILFGGKASSTPLDTGVAELCKHAEDNEPVLPTQFLRGGSQVAMQSNRVQPRHREAEEMLKARYVRVRVSRLNASHSICQRRNIMRAFSQNLVRLDMPGIGSLTTPLKTSPWQPTQQKLHGISRHWDNPLATSLESRE